MPESHALAAIALGSNLPSRFGDPAANLREALHRLGDLGELTAISSFYVTEPVGYQQQPNFVNAAALLATQLSPLDLLHGLLEIEQAMGRRRGADLPPKGPRIIDLDLLLYESAQGASLQGASLQGASLQGTSLQGTGLVLHDPELTLPHPEMHRRRFVLAPLAEIAPSLEHPVLHRAIADLLADLLADLPPDLPKDLPKDVSQPQP